MPRSGAPPGIATLTLLATIAAAPAVASADAAARLGGLAPGLDPEVLERALAAVDCAPDAEIAGAPILGIIDYALPSSEARLWVFDRAVPQLLFHGLVAHGSGSGEGRAERFSNRHGSRQSSLGLFRAAEVYHGRNGYSLRLDGLDPGVNDQARARAIVMHGAWYVSEEFVARHGRLGRSWGCPAVESTRAGEVIDTLKQGGVLFVSGDDPAWLATVARRCRPGQSGRPEKGTRGRG